MPIAIRLDLLSPQSVLGRSYHHRAGSALGRKTSLKLKYRARPQPGSARSKRYHPLGFGSLGFHNDQEACKFQIEEQAKKEAKKLEAAEKPHHTRSYLFRAARIFHIGPGEFGTMQLSYWWLTMIPSKASIVLPALQKKDIRGILLLHCNGQDGRTGARELWYKGRKRRQPPFHGNARPQCNYHRLSSYKASPTIDSSYGDSDTSGKLVLFPPEYLRHSCRIE